MAEDGVADGEVDVYQAVAAHQTQPVLVIKACLVILDTVVVEGVARADYWMYGVAQGVGIGEHQGKDTVATVEVVQVLLVRSRVGVAFTVEQEVAAEAHVAVYGLAQGVAAVYHDGQYAVAAACCVQVLTVGAGIPIGLVVDGEVAARTDGVPYRVADGVADGEVDNEVLETARNGVAQILGVNTGTPVRSVGLTVHRHTAEVIVGVEGYTGTNNRVYGVAKGVVHSNFDNLDAVAVVVALEILVVGTLYGVNRVVMGERSTGTNGVADSVAVRRLNGNTEDSRRRTDSGNLGVAIASMTSFGGATRCVGEQGVSGHSLCVVQITAAVEQASRRIVACRSGCINISGAAATASTVGTAAAVPAAAATTGTTTHRIAPTTLAESTCCLGTTSGTITLRSLCSSRTTACG